MWPFIKSKRNDDSKDFKYKYFSNDKLSDSPDYELSELYGRCVEEMTLQQSKRDQVFTLYLAMFSFLVPFALSTAGISDVAKGVIFIALAVIGWMFALIIERYRIYKESYWLCCQTITNLMSFKKGSLDKRTIQAVYYRCIVKKAEKYINTKKKKYKRFFFYKSNIFSGETIYYLIHSFITAGMVYLGIYQIIPYQAYQFLAISVALLVFVILTIFYFERLLEVYSVLLDDTGDAFNVAFSKAWFLHFYVEKSKYDIATSFDLEGEVLKGVVPNAKAFFHHLEEGKIIENDKENSCSKIIIVAQGAVSLNGKTIYKKGICKFSADENYTLKAEAETTLVEIRVRNQNEEPVTDIIKLYECEKPEEHINSDVHQLIYTFEDNKCKFNIKDKDSVYLGGDTLFYIPVGTEYSVCAEKDCVAEYVSVEMKI